MEKGTQKEIKEMLAAGMKQYAKTEIIAEFKALGYTLYNFERYYNTGNTNNYHAYIVQIKETDTGISAWHYRDARRDANFNAMQKMRKNCFGVSKGAIIEL